MAQKDSLSAFELWHGTNFQANRCDMMNALEVKHFAFFWTETVQQFYNKQPTVIWAKDEILGLLVIFKKEARFNDA